MQITERGLIRISLIGILVGLVALYFVTQSLVPEKNNVSDITIGLSGSQVEVTGNITDLKKSGDNLFFSLSDGTGSIKVVLWKNTLDRLKLQGIDLEKLKNGNSVVVVGTVEGYKGELEIILLKVVISE